MSQKYFKPHKKYVSRSLATQKLKITPKQFERMVVLCSVYPIQATEKNCLDRVEGWYYTVDDIKRIYYSDAYDVLLKNKYSEAKREKYLRFNRQDKAQCFTEEEYGLVDLIRNKYANLGDSLSDLGTSLKNLYFIKMLGIEDVDCVTGLFETFVLENKLLGNAFLSRKGVFYSFDVEKIRIVWSVPYPAADFSEIIEEKLDIEEKIKTTGIKFLDFDSSSEEESAETHVDPNDPDKQDISLLRYAAPLLATHVKLAVHKIRLLYGQNIVQKTGLFRARKVCVLIRSIPREIEFVLKNEGADLVGVDDAEMVVAESVDGMKENVLYVQPQYVFDVLNANELLDHRPYLVGRDLPRHVSPFPDILESLDSRVLKTLSNTKKYRILDKVVELN